MKKVNFKNILLFLMMTAFVCTAAFVPQNTRGESVAALNLSAVFESQEIGDEESKVYNVFDSYRSSYFSAEKRVSKIRQLTDFAGNEYILSEFLPVGYMILHKESANIVERSERDISPYFGMTGELIYGGPTYYYQKEDELFRHTVLEEEIYGLTHEMIADSEAKHEEHSKTINIATKNYLHGSTANKSALNAGVVPMAATVTEVAVHHPNFYRQMNNCGYMVVGGGVCGYIGANLLLSYFGTYDMIGPSGNGTGNTNSYFLANEHKVTWVNSSAKTGAKLQVGLTNYLYNDIGISLGKSPATISGDIRDVCVEYFSRRGITGVNHTSLWTPFFSSKTVYEIVERKWPALVFGNLQDPSGSDKMMHAVTVYKATKTTNVFSSYELTANFGWSNGTARYNEVIVSGTLGSMYYFSW